MAELPSATELSNIATLLAPGLIILGIRTRFKEGAVPALKDRVIGYAVASAGYYAAVAPLFHVSWGVSLSAWFWGLCQFFAVPCLIGAAIVWFDQSEWFYRLCSKAGFRLAHHIPAAWDYAFSKVVKGTFVWVKLTNGTEYAGVMAVFFRIVKHCGARPIFRGGVEYRKGEAVVAYGAATGGALMR